MYDDTRTMTASITLVKSSTNLFNSRISACKSSNNMKGNITKFGMEMAQKKLY